MGEETGDPDPDPLHFDPPGSVSVINCTDPDSDPDPALFVCGFQDYEKKVQIFLHLESRQKKVGSGSDLLKWTFLATRLSEIIWASAGVGMCSFTVR